MGPMDLGIAPASGGRMKLDMGGGLGANPGAMGAGPLDIGPPKGMAAPNLRPAEDPGASCGVCAAFDGQGMCKKFGNPCQPTDTCDGFEAGGGQDALVAPPAPSAPPMMG